MALTITDDHAAQEAAFYCAPEWQRGASVLRERLTEREIDATHPLVRFAGLDAYTAAGGGLRRDLFAEGDAGTYLTDAVLLETLVRGKLDALAGDVRAEGWAWVEAVPHMSYAERQAFQNAPRQRREPSAREARRIASLQTRLDKIDAELEEAYDAEDEDKTEALEPRREQVAGLGEPLGRGNLGAVAGEGRAEGWAGVEAVPHMSYAERQAFQNAPRQRREPSAREARRIASLQTRLDKIDAELEEAYDAEDEDKTEALEPRREQVAGELQAVEQALQGYAPDVRAVAGAIVTLDRSEEHTSELQSLMRISYDVFCLTK